MKAGVSRVLSDKRTANFWRKRAGIRNGFTLPEVLIGSAVAMIVIGGAVNIYVMSHRILKEGMVKTDLCTNAAKIIKHMSENLIQATELEVTPYEEEDEEGTAIRFRLRNDVTDRWYYLETSTGLGGNPITEVCYYDGTTAAYITNFQGEVTVSLSFTAFDSGMTTRAVRIELALEQEVYGTRAGGVTSRVDISTVVNRRN